jgi:pepF/M3 family oligoendopeptidase
MSQTQEASPRWDMTAVFPSLESEEFEGAFRGMEERIRALGTLFDRHGVGKVAPAPPDDAAGRAFEEVVEELDRALDEFRTVSAYVRCFVATDAGNALAQSKLSELQRTVVRLSLLDTRFAAWIGSLDVDALLARSRVAREHAFALRKAKVEAEHQMSPLEEELAAELRPSGSTAWVKLHADLSSLLTVRLELDGRGQDLAITEVRNLALDPDREVRRRAHLAEIAAWKTSALPLAAALNSIKEGVNVLCDRRGWRSPLDLALFESAIDRPTLDAMMTAARESFPDFRRYLRAKARALGVPVLAWYDLFAPVGEGGREWTFGEGTRFIAEQFGTYSPRLRELAERAFREGWIDAEPRAGKRGGAWCMSIRRDESRVLSNFKPSFSGVSTLAHELGHAYHNLCLANRTMLQRDTPMTLAETASIFCETLVSQAGLRVADPAEQFVILEDSLQNACQVVVDITARFLFEQELYERRRKRELSVDELNEVTLGSLHQAYGDGVDPTTLHPYMWAVKAHYYQLSFYNYPYMFGLLFGLGLYARYAEDPNAFVVGYDDLLSSTGLADAAELASRYGIDTHSAAFWRSSLDVVRSDITRFEALVAGKSE